MKIVMIGAGNVATHLAKALFNASYDVVQVFSRDIKNAKQLADDISAEAICNLNDIYEGADAYIISVKDDAIEAIAERLSGKMRSGALLIHTAGSVPLSVLCNMWNNSAVLYPMQTFSKSRELDFSKVPCFVEGNGEIALEQVRNIAETISNKVQIADSEQRRYMHLAAVFACNMVNHCYRMAEQIVEEHSLDFDMFLPLIEETAEKVKVMRPSKAQTGPMVRNDKKVMEAQKALLHDERKRKIYELMAESIYEDSQKNLSF